LLVLPDLSVPADSITYAQVDTTGALSAAVENFGGVASANFAVNFYRSRFVRVLRANLQKTNASDAF